MLELIDGRGIRSRCQRPYRNAARSLPSNKFRGYRARRRAQFSSQCRIRSPIIVAGGGNGGISTHADNAANRIATAVHAEHFDNRWFGGDTITALLLAVF
jgi:hypothetical protein